MLLLSKNCLFSRGLELVSLLLIITILVMSLQGCGWRLRGSQSVDLVLPPVYLSVQNASAELRRDLTQALKSSDVKLLSSADEAALRLTVHREHKERRVLSIGGSGKVREYDLHYRLEFSVTDQVGGEVLPRREITLQRDYEFDETQVLAKGEEERQLYDFMRRQAVQSLLRSLQTLAKSKSEENMEQEPVLEADSQSENE